MLNIEFQGQTRCHKTTSLFKSAFGRQTIKESQTQGETLKVTGNCKLEKAINTLKAHAIY